MTSNDARVPIGLKEWLTIASLIFVAGGAWTMNQFQDNAIASQEVDFDALQTEKAKDDLAQQALAMTVDGMAKAVDSIRDKQDNIVTEQTVMNRELYEQRTMLQSNETKLDQILEQLKTP